MVTPMRASEAKVMARRMMAASMLYADRASAPSIMSTVFFRP